MQTPHTKLASLGGMFLVSILGSNISGCCIFDQGSKPVPVGKALHQMAVDLGQLRILVPSDLISVKSADLASLDFNDLSNPKYNPVVVRIATILKESQCFDVDGNSGQENSTLRKENALIPVSTGPLQLTVQGQISVSGTFSISAPPSVGGTVARETQQQLMLPLTLTSLATLPSFFVGQQLGYLQYVTLVPTFKSDDPTVGTTEQAEIKAYVATILDVGSKLNTLTSDALTQFHADPDTYCKGEGTAGGDVLGVPARPLR